PPAGAPVRGRPGATPAVAPITGPAAARITVTLDNIPLGEALRYVANQAGLKVKIEPYAVTVIPLSEQSNDLITKRYHVPPEFFGGPLDVGYYVGQTFSGGGQQGQNSYNVPPVSQNVIEKEQYTAATTTEYVAASQAQGTVGGYTTAGQQSVRQNPGGIGTSTTRQSLFNDRQLVGRADARTMLETMGAAFPPGASATFW